MMRKRIVFLAALLVCILVIGAAAEGRYGAAAVAAGETYTPEQMLRFALEDEYLARDEYIAIMTVFGEVRPFSRIKQAEDRHIAMLDALFRAYGLETPGSGAKDYLKLPDTLAEAYEAGVGAELLNIAMYEQFLKQEDLPQDLTRAFNALKRASENHLAAFCRQAERGRLPDRRR